MDAHYDAILRQTFGVLYKKHKYNNFKILCIDAEQRGFTQAMEAYGVVALRLAAEIQNEAK